MRISEFSGKKKPRPLLSIVPLSLVTTFAQIFSQNIYFYDGSEIRAFWGFFFLFYFFFHFDVVNSVQTVILLGEKHPCAFQAQAKVTSFKQWSSRFLQMLVSGSIMNVAGSKHFNQRIRQRKVNLSKIYAQLMDEETFARADLRGLS